MPKKEESFFAAKEVTNVKEKWLSMLADLNVCSQKGLVEMFDSSIGAGSVVMPYGGKNQLTEVQTMVAKVPVAKGNTDAVTMMSYGFNPYLSSWSPYHGSVYAVTESIAKITAAGGDYSKIRMTFQEYFRRMTEDSHTWGLPFASLLGAYAAQMGFGLPSIGGKDSMSGSFDELNVPPTLVSFAVDVASENDVVTPEFKKAGNKLVLFSIEKDEYDLPNYEQVKKLYGQIHEAVRKGQIVSSYAIGAGGIAEAVSKMAFGNGLGAVINAQLDKNLIFAPLYGNILAEVPTECIADLEVPCEVIGEVSAEPTFTYGEIVISMDEAVKSWKSTLEKVFPSVSGKAQPKVDTGIYKADSIYVCKNKIAKPKVFIPVFPGTNCEYDSAKAFERAGAEAIVKVVRNQTAEEIRESVDIFTKAIRESQIIMFPGGFSAGDEPDGSAKFFATAFRNEKLKEAVMDLLNNRDGLVLGICNGFQTLVKLGLVPYGEIIDSQLSDSPTLTTNTIGRHVSKMAYLKVVSNKSPWLAQATLGGVYCNPVSHGEGRFVASKEWLDKLFANGQVATQYVDYNGNLAQDEEWNMNGSYAAIEGITSPDGRVYGKMAHSERIGDSVAINIYGEQDLKLFESGVKYFK